MPRTRLALAALTSAAAIAASGCGSQPAAEPQPAKPASHAPVRPEDARCADLATKPAAHRLARKLVDRVVAPDGQSERQTIGIIGESLYATCRQPRLPGVSNMRNYRPVKSVLEAIQRDFDEQEITGG